MKPKLILISGLTGVGKTLIASNLAKRLNTEIITGDSLQIYKNYPISANCPPVSIREQVKYNLIEQIDVFKQRIIVSDYKDMVVREIDRLHKENKIPIIEGGSGFYLNYLLTGSKQPYTEDEWIKASEQAARLTKDVRNSESLIAKLKELCPNYDDSIQKNDVYRLEKALKYAFATKGQSWKAVEDAEGKLKDIFDVRGYFITMDQLEIKRAIDKRCYEMEINGAVEEFLAFTNQMKKSYLNYSEIPVPIGFTEIQKLVNGLIELEGNKFVDESQTFRKAFQLCRNFSGEFQAASRQYAATQRKYFRSRFKYFLWRELKNYPTAGSLKHIVDSMYDEIMLPEDQFKAKVQTPTNLKLINQLSDSTKTRTMAPTYELKSDNQVAQHMRKVVMPKLAGAEPIKIFTSVSPSV